MSGRTRRWKEQESGQNSRVCLFAAGACLNLVYEADAVLLYRPGWPRPPWPDS